MVIRPVPSETPPTQASYVGWGIAGAFAGFILSAMITRVLWATGITLREQSSALLLWSVVTVALAGGLRVARDRRRERGLEKRAHRTWLMHLGWGIVGGYVGVVFAIVLPFVPWIERHSVSVKVSTMLLVLVGLVAGTRVARSQLDR